MDTKWHYMKDEEPTLLEKDRYWAWNYALVLNTEYDCIGNYLAGFLFKPDFEKRIFSTPLTADDSLDIPFSEVVAWARLDMLEDKEES